MMLELFTYPFCKFIFVSLVCFIIAEELFRIYFIFTAAGVVPCGGYKTSLGTSSYCRLYIFWCFGIILSQFENRVSLKPVLGGVCSVVPLYYCA